MRAPACLQRIEAVVAARAALEDAAREQRSSLLARREEQREAARQERLQEQRRQERAQAQRQWLWRLAATSALRVWAGAVQQRRHALIVAERLRGAASRIQVSLLWCTCLRSCMRVIRYLCTCSMLCVVQQFVTRRAPCTTIRFTPCYWQIFLRAKMLMRRRKRSYMLLEVLCCLPVVFTDSLTGHRKAVAKATTFALIRMCAQSVRSFVRWLAVVRHVVKRHRSADVLKMFLEVAGRLSVNVLCIPLTIASHALLPSAQRLRGLFVSYMLWSTPA